MSYQGPKYGSYFCRNFILQKLREVLLGLQKWEILDIYDSEKQKKLKK